MKTNLISLGAVLVGCMFGLVQSGNAVLIADPEIAYENGYSVTPSMLSGTIDVSLSGDSKTLTITVANTTPDAAGNGVGVALTGVGVYIPDFDNTIMVTPVSDTFTGTPAGFTGTSFLGEWGYSVPASGGAFGVGSYAYSVGVGTITDMTKDGPFPGGDIDNTSIFDGPDFGMLSALETSTMLQEHVWGGSTMFVLTFSEAINMPTHGILTFASPDSVYRRVPDGGSTAMILGLAMSGLAVLTRRFRK